MGAKLKEENKSKVEIAKKKRIMENEVSHLTRKNHSIFQNLTSGVQTVSLKTDLSVSESGLLNYFAPTVPKNVGASNASNEDLSDYCFPKN